MEEVTSLEGVDRNLIKVAEKVIHLWAVESCCAIFAQLFCSPLCLSRSIGPHLSGMAKKIENKLSILDL